MMPVTITTVTPYSEESSDAALPMKERAKSEKLDKTGSTKKNQRTESAYEVDSDSGSGDSENEKPAKPSKPAHQPRPKPSIDTHSISPRINTVLDNVPHDDFAAEFIKDAGIKSEKAIIEAMHEEAEFLAGPTLQTGTIDEAAHEPIKAYNRDTQTSIKIVYTPPVWPHHVPLYTTLSKLPFLRSLILDDSKIRWLR